MCIDTKYSTEYRSTSRFSPENFIKIPSGRAGRVSLLDKLGPPLFDSMIANNCRKYGTRPLRRSSDSNGNSVEVVFLLCFQ